MKKSLTELSEEVDVFFKPVDVHLEKIEQGKGRGAMLLAAIVGAVEIWGIFCVERLGTSVAVALMGHVTIVAVIALYGFARFQYRRDCRFEMALCLMVLAMGPFGAAGIVLAICTHMHAKQTYHSFEQFFESLSPTHTKTRSQTIYEDILSGRDDASEQHYIIPFLDVLSFGSEVQKRQAIAKMTHHFQPDFAAVFRKALNDPSNMIRVQAATAIARIESQFLRRMNKISIIKSLGNADPKMLLAVAEHYDNYAYTGLLDHDNEIMNRNKALELYYKYNKLNPRDHEIYVKIGRVMMRNGDYEHACYWFSQYIENHPQKKQIAPSITDWYSESLFLARQYEDLRRYRSGLPPVNNREDFYLVSLKEALHLWEGTHYAAS